MKIVILDKLDFPEEAVARLRLLGDVEIHQDYPSADQVADRLASANIAIVGWSTIRREALQKSPLLNCVALALTGYEVIDLEAARENEVTVCNVPGYSRQSVAEYAFALALALARHIREADAEVRQGNALSPPVSLLGHELYTKTLGILGLGNIGSWMARIGLGFGMKVIAHSRTRKNMPSVEDVSLVELVRRSDILMVAVDTQSATANILSAEHLANMKKEALLVNITSNQVLDEDALASLLGSGRLAGAAFDDVSHSGHDDDSSGRLNPLLALPNVLLSPQAGWYTGEAEQRLYSMVVDNVENFANGRPTNVLT